MLNLLLGRRVWSFVYRRRMVRRFRSGDFVRRRALYGVVVERSRKWLIIGVIAWAYHWIYLLLVGSEPTAKYTRDIGPGERVFVLHEPTSARAANKQAKEQRKAAKRAR